MQDRRRSQYAELQLAIELLNPETSFVQETIKEPGGPTNQSSGMNSRNCFLKDSKSTESGSFEAQKKKKIQPPTHNTVRLRKNTETRTFALIHSMHDACLLSSSSVSPNLRLKLNPDFETDWMNDQIQ